MPKDGADFQTPRLQRMLPPMSGPNPRKRPAPGAAPAAARQQQQMQQPYSPDQLLLWNGGVSDANGYMDPSGNANAYMLNAQAPYGGAFAQPSTAMTRIQQNNALIPAGQGWGNAGDDALFQPPSNGAADGNDSIENLEERAAVAKKDSQSKRKQIPPFVQKLSSFLEQQKNTDLIRWSDKGDSFIVIDEDEFAKTLIPELFKHNNYASFVRQLNMYGFHKRVGLSDNSMKASERKNKSPSEYYNPFFRRGHPNLLWLINKPKSGNKKKGKKEDGDVDSDDEGGLDEAPGFGPTTAGPAPRSIPAGDIGTVQKKDLQVVREQLNSLQQQQKIITAMIARLRQEHTTMYQQAVMFQNMHERHENSIKAILNFLANVFRKQLEEQGGSQNMKDLLDSIIPGAQMPHGGSVFEVGDIDLSRTQAGSSISPMRRQKPLLLPPVPPGTASTVASPSSNAAPSPYNPNTGYGQSGMVTEVFDTPTDTSSPNYLRQDHQTSISQEGMMKIIQDTNAGNPTGIDLPESSAKARVTNLTNDQQNHMIGMMSGQKAAQPGSTPAAPRSAASMPNPTGAGASPAGTSNSLSPILSSIPPPSINDIKANQEELSALQRLQAEQNAKLADLEQILGPLSPSGRITPLSDNGGLPAGPGYFDVNQFFDSDAYDLNFDPASEGHLPPADLGAPEGNVYGGGEFGAAMPGLGDGTDFDFSLDQGAGGLPDGLDPNAGWNATVVAGQNSSSNAPSPAVTEEIARNDLETSPRSKRRRVG